MTIDAAIRNMYDGRVRGMVCIHIHDYVVQDL